MDGVSGPRVGGVMQRMALGLLEGGESHWKEFSVRQAGEGLSRL